MKTGKTFPHQRLTVFLALLALSLVAVACARNPNLAPGDSLKLTTYSENDVSVEVRLQRAESGETLLAATFTPLEAGFHLYSKDIPLAGVDGLGRPTRLELTANSKMQAAGALRENIPSETPDFEPKDLLVYPAGAVTLTLPITLPSGAGWIADEISVSFMACSSKGCKAPVVGKILSVEVPGTK
jgi:hypothetical protein